MDQVDRGAARAYQHTYRRVPLLCLVASLLPDGRGHHTKHCQRSNLIPPLPVGLFVIKIVKLNYPELGLTTNASKAPGPLGRIKSGSSFLVSRIVGTISRPLLCIMRHACQAFFCMVAQERRFTLINIATQYIVVCSMTPSGVWDVKETLSDMTDPCLRWCGLVDYS